MEYWDKYAGYSNYIDYSTTMFDEAISVRGCDTSSEFAGWQSGKERDIYSFLEDHFRKSLIVYTRRSNKEVSFHTVVDVRVDKKAIKGNKNRPDFTLEVYPPMKSPFDESESNLIAVEVKARKKGSKDLNPTALVREIINKSVKYRDITPFVGIMIRPYPTLINKRVARVYGDPRLVFEQGGYAGYVFFPAKIVAWALRVGFFVPAPPRVFFHPNGLVIIDRLEFNMQTIMEFYPKNLVYRGILRKSAMLGDSITKLDRKP